MLSPLMAVAYNRNNRVIAACKLLSRNVREALEQVVELRPNDCAEAQQELGRMDSNACRVKGQSVGG